MQPTLNGFLHCGQRFVRIRTLHECKRVIQTLRDLCECLFRFPPRFECLTVLSTAETFTGCLKHFRQIVIAGKLIEPFDLVRKPLYLRWSIVTVLSHILHLGAEFI